MSNMVSATSAGLNSLSGFSFQIKVFILMMTYLKENQRVEFETLDDVVVKNLFKTGNDDDNCIKTCTIDDGDIVAFQVKQTNISNSVARKVLYNWLLASARQEPRKARLLAGRCLQDYRLCRHFCQLLFCMICQMPLPAQPIMIFCLIVANQTVKSPLKHKNFFVFLQKFFCACGIISPTLF